MQDAEELRQTARNSLVVDRSRAWRGLTLSSTDGALPHAATCLSGRCPKQQQRFEMIQTSIRYANSVGAGINKVAMPKEADVSGDIVQIHVGTGTLRDTYCSGASTQTVNSMPWVLPAPTSAMFRKAPGQSSHTMSGQDDTIKCPQARPGPVLLTRNRDHHPNGRTACRAPEGRRSRRHPGSWPTTDPLDRALGPKLEQ